MSRGTPHPPPFDELARRIEGSLCTDAVHRVLLSTDASIFQVRPAAVVYPAGAGDVAETVRFARRNGLTLHPRGAGSGLCGAALGRGIVVDFTRHMNRPIRLDTAARIFTCEPGYRLGELEVALDGSGLFFPPDPSTGEYATFGGMTGTNASGSHSVKYGNTADYLVDADMVLWDGNRIRLSEVAATPVDRLPHPLGELAALYERHRESIEAAYPETPFNTAGYNLRGLVRNGRLDLRRLVAGAEGTLGVATRLAFRLADRPGHDSLVVAYMDDIVSSARAVQAVLPMGPSGIEIMDKSLLRLAREHDPALGASLPEGVDNVLMVEFDGFDPQGCTAAAAAVIRLLADRGFTRRAYPAVTAAEKARFWAVRKAAVPILNRLKGARKVLALIEDAAVPVRNLVGYFEGIYELLHRHGVRFVTYGHIAKGLMHTRPLLDLRDPTDVRRLRPIADDFYDLVRSLDGTVSGEHGDGRLRSAYIRRRYPGIYPLFLRVKELMDPEGLFNPEIITRDDPDQMTRDLRYAKGYRRPPAPTTRLIWREGYVAEAEKCHGCSRCTTLTHATRMCPVYKATREESASPKAKANVLRAVIDGRLPGEEGFRDAFEAVLRRCIHCGSCRRECPSGVDVPTLVLEARARYAERFGIPAADRLLTRLEEAARAAGPLIPLAAPALRSAAVRRLVERAAGVSARRDLLLPARRPLRMGPVRGSVSGTERVLFFAGCFARFVDPGIGRSAIQVLEALGAEVLLPEQHCCGLPLLSKGRVREAADKVRRNLRRWGPTLSSVDAVVVTCPSCGLALTEKWGALTDDPLLQDIREKTVPIGAFVTPRSDRLLLGRTSLDVAYHTPCHLRVQPDPEVSVRMLRTLEGAAVTPLRTHCCGMAGGWGMTADHYDLSVRMGEDLAGRLAASGADVAATDCPTCRMQIAHITGLPVRHPVQIVADRLAAP